MGKRQSSVERTYEQLREMAANFEFKPQERLNETTLSSQLGASRTPLREALNRLVAEGLLTFENGRGFFCRPLDPVRIQDLYEARIALETEALKRTLERASEVDITAFRQEFDAQAEAYQNSTDPAELLRMDEDFHRKLAALSGNAELVAMLQGINLRIRYVRLVNLTELMKQDQPRLAAHGDIVAQLVARDAPRALAVLRDHIEQRQEETARAVRLAFAKLYVPD